MREIQKGLAERGGFYEFLSVEYCSFVRLRKTPPRPISIAWFSACRLSRFDNPPPRSTNSTTLSGEAKRSFLGRGVCKSSSRNWQCQPWRHWNDMYTRCRGYWLVMDS